MNSKHCRRSRILAGVAVLVILATGCAAPARNSAPVAGATTTSASAADVPSSAAGAASAAKLDHVVIIVEENKPATKILGNPAAPYLNKLAADYAVATNYSAVRHPSLPNYLALTGGTTSGISSDCSPGPGCMATGKSVTDEISASGRSWKMYAGAMTSPCQPHSAGGYAVKHNPFLYYPSVTTDAASCAAHDVPFEQLAEDLKAASTLPDYSFISPDLCHDMHDCSIATGDTWLATHAAAILASPAFTTQNSLLVVTWDEGSGTDNRVFTIFAGPAAKRGATSARLYGHYALLHTIESRWGLAPLTSHDAEAPIMADLLN